MMTNKRADHFAYIQQKKIEQAAPGIIADYQARKQGYESGHKIGFEEGWKQGVKESGRLAYRPIYGAIMIKLHDMYGFGKQRLYNLLKATDERILESLEHQELIDEAWEKTGLELNFDAPFDRIEQEDE